MKMALRRAAAALFLLHFAHSPVAAQDCTHVTNGDTCTVMQLQTQNVTASGAGSTVVLDGGEIIVPILADAVTLEDGAFFNGVDGSVKGGFGAGDGDVVVSVGKIAIKATGSSTVEISGSGGTYLGGSSFTTVEAVGGDALHTSGGCHVFISGNDQFRGGDGRGTINTGGVSGNAATLIESTFSIFGGHFHGGTSNVNSAGNNHAGTALKVQDSTGDIRGGIFEGGDTFLFDNLLTDESPSLQAALQGRSIFAIVNSIVDIYGGTFDGEWFISTSSIVRVYGCNTLSFDGNVLSGTLSDGSPIVVDVDRDCANPGSGADGCLGTLEIVEYCPGGSKGGKGGKGKGSKSGKQGKQSESSSTQAEERAIGNGLVYDKKEDEVVSGGGRRLKPLHRRVRKQFIKP